MYEQKLEIREFSPYSPERVSPNPRVETVKQQMNNFLGLLQKSIESDKFVTSQESSSPQPPKKLSTILSASEDNESSQAHNKPATQSDNYQSKMYYEKYFQSSSMMQDTFMKPVVLDKSTLRCSHPHRSSLHSHLPPLTSNEAEIIYRLFDESSFFSECEAQLSQKQSHLLTQFKQIVRDYNDYIAVLQERNQQLLVKCEKYKVKSEHLLKALLTVRDEEKGMIDKIQRDRQKWEDGETEKKELVVSVDRLNKEVEVLRSENAYLKDLIILANKNYENIEKKLSDSEEKNKKLEQATRQRESELLEGNAALKQVILKLGKQVKSSKQLSPLRDRTNEEQNKPISQNTQNSIPSQHTTKTGQIEQTYRKMFIKTLKWTKK